MCNFPPGNSILYRPWKDTNVGVPLLTNQLVEKNKFAGWKGVWIAAAHQWLSDLQYSTDFQNQTAVQILAPEPEHVSVRGKKQE